MVAGFHILNAVVQLAARALGPRQTNKKEQWFVVECSLKMKGQNRQKAVCAFGEGIICVLTVLSNKNVSHGNYKDSDRPPRISLETQHSCVPMINLMH